MLRYRRQRHRVGPCQIGHAAVAPGEMGEDSPARRVGQGGKSAIQHFWRIFNHLVNYIAARFEACKHFFQLAPDCRSPVMAPAAVTIGQAEIARSAPKSSASIANAQWFSVAKKFLVNSRNDRRLVDSFVPLALEMIRLIVITLMIERNRRII